MVEEFPADWLAFAGLGPVRRVDVIDANLSTITAEADKVLRVDGPEPWLAHVEFQTGHQADLPRRLLRYPTLLDDRHDLPTGSLVVLLRPEADGPDLSGVYRRSLPGAPIFWSSGTTWSGPGSSPSRPCWKVGWGPCRWPRSPT